MPSPYPFRHFLTVPRNIPVQSDAGEWLAKQQGVLEDLRRVPAGEECPLRAELSIPIDAELGLFTIASPLGLQGYRFEAIGTYMPNFIDALVAIARGQFFFELWIRSDAATLHTIPLAMWRRRVFYKDGPASLEACWQPSHGETVTMKGLEHFTRVTEAQKVLSKGMRVLKKLGGGGRRPGPDGFKDTQELENILIVLIQEADAKGQSTKQNHIAALLRPEVTNRRGDADSAASVDVDLDSTIRWVRKHLSCSWRELVKKALQSR